MTREQWRQQQQQQRLAGYQYKPGNRTAAQLADDIKPIQRTGETPAQMQQRIQQAQAELDQRNWLPQGNRPNPGERSMTQEEYYGDDGPHRLNRGTKKPVSPGDRTELAQPGGLNATEGRQVVNANGPYAGQPGPAAHPIARHSPDIPLHQVRARVGTGPGQVRQSTRFLDRAKMEAAIAENI
jgi:hypothetical protein